MFHPYNTRRQAKVKAMLAQKTVSEYTLEEAIAYDQFSKQMTHVLSSMPHADSMSSKINLFISLFETMLKTNVCGLLKTKHPKMLESVLDKKEHIQEMYEMYVNDGERVNEICAKLSDFKIDKKSAFQFVKVMEEVYAERKATIELFEKLQKLVAAVIEQNNHTRPPASTVPLRPLEAIEENPVEEVEVVELPSEQESKKMEDFEVVLNSEYEVCW